MTIVKCKDYNCISNAKGVCTKKIIKLDGEIEPIKCVCMDREVENETVLADT